MTTPLRFRSFLVLTILALTMPAAAQMRVVTYNCARLQGNANAFGQVIAALMVDDKPGFAVPPWVFVFEEVPSSIDDDLLAVLNAMAPPGVTYAEATYTSSVLEDGSGGAIAMYYRPDKLTEIPAGHVDIPTGGNRNTDRWLLLLDDYTNPQLSFYIYGSHLKADTGAQDVADRNAAAIAIRNNANTLPAGARILYLGDLNIYSNTEAAYLTFTAPGNGRAIDAFGNGSWAGAGNAIKHSQSPCESCLPHLVGGGLNDRFDFIFFTESFNGATGFGRMPGTYRTFGNDGQHYDDDINVGNNFYYPGQLSRSNALADALHDASDHMPVILDFRLPAIAHAEMAPLIGPVIEGALVTHPVTITNIADAATPAATDTLSALVIGLGGLTGNGAANVGPLPDSNVINLTLDTSAPGVINCGAAVFSTGTEVQNANIVLDAEATVLRHAVASFVGEELLDDAVVTASFEAGSGVQQIDVPVFNVGFDALQAELDVDSVSSPRPPFAIAGPLPQGIGEAPATLTFTIDTTKLRPGMYAADVTIGVSDEDLPGEGAGSMALRLEVTITREAAPPCPGDMVNNVTFAPPSDGVVDGADLAFLLGEWGPAPGSPADLVNNVTFTPPPDGVVDAADLAVLLGNWGACE